MDFEYFKKLKVEDLKSYLRLRGLKVSGRRDELIARCFAAWENNVPTIKTAEESEHDLGLEYTSKLKIGSVSVPDPEQLKEGWLSENDGIKFWPNTLYPDIFNFLSFHPGDLNKLDLNDYKQSKGY